MYRHAPGQAGDKPDQVSQAVSVTICNRRSQKEMNGLRIGVKTSVNTDMGLVGVEEVANCKFKL